MTNPIIITVFGVGFVGRTLVDHLLSHDHRSYVLNLMDPGENVLGSLLDLGHASMLHKQHVVHWNHDDLVPQSDLVFHAAGPSIPKGASRLSVTAESVEITRTIFSGLRFKEDAFAIVIANPLDIVTWHVQHASGLPNHRVVGTGALVDTIRFEYFLKKALGVNAADVEALTLGEHGHSLVPIWSHTNVEGMETHQISEEVRTTCLEETIHAALNIRKTQGATSYGVVHSAMRLMETVLQPEPVFLPICTRLNSHWCNLLGCSDVALSVPTIVSSKGAFPVQDFELTETELSALRQSAGLVARHLKP